MIGLSENLLANYVEWICNRRMKASVLKLYIHPSQEQPTAGLSTGLSLRVSRWHHKRQRLSLTSSVASNRTFRRTPSLVHLMRQTHYYEIHEGDQDGVRVICRCGSEEDATMMMLHNRRERTGAGSRSSSFHPTLSTRRRED